MGNVKTSAREKPIESGEYTKSGEILELAAKRFKQGIEAEAEFREQAIEEIKFHSGKDQWDESARRFREDDDRICLTVNRMPAFTRQVSNDIRQMRPRINVNALSGGANSDTAAIYTGIIRAIEQRSSAERAYDWASRRAIIMGRGAFRVGIKYEDGFSFKRRIFISRIKNDLSIVPDPSHEELDGSDMNWCFLYSDMEKDEFKAAYPDASMDWDAMTAGANAESWVGEDYVRVSEYWTKEVRTETLSMMPDGSIVEGDVEGAIMTRDVKRNRVICRLITGSEILEETVWPSQYIGIVLVYGDEEDIEGERHVKGMVRDLMDSQRSYNFGKSVEAETIALSPKAPWVGPEGSFEDPKWLDANKRNYPYLEYVNKGAPPSQAQPPAAGQGASVMMDRSSMEMRDVSGIHESGLGAQAPEQAGVAIRQRRSEADVSNFHFVDNLASSIQHAGRILVELIRDVNKGPQQLSIVEMDGTEKRIWVNRPAVDEETQKQYFHDLTNGVYDATVDTGPAYSTLREESSQGMLDLMRINPGFASLLGDLAVRAMDWPDAKAAAERLKLMLPPAVQAEQNPQVQMLTQQIQQMQQQAQQQIAALQKNMGILAARLEEKQAELQIKRFEAETKRMEVSRKQQEDSQDLAVDMTKLEIDANKDVPGSVI